METVKDKPAVSHDQIALDEKLLYVIRCGGPAWDTESIAAYVARGANVMYRRKHTKVTIIDIACSRAPLRVVAALMKSPTLDLNVRPGHILDCPLAHMIRRNQEVPEATLIRMLDRMTVVTDTRKPQDSLLLIAIQCRLYLLAHALIDRNVHVGVEGLFHACVCAENESMWAIVDRLIALGHTLSGIPSTGNRNFNALDWALQVGSRGVAERVFPFTEKTPNTVMYYALAGNVEMLVTLAEMDNAKELFSADTGAQRSSRPMPVQCKDTINAVRFLFYEKPTPTTIPVMQALRALMPVAQKPLLVIRFPGSLDNRPPVDAHGNHSLTPELNSVPLCRRLLRAMMRHGALASPSMREVLPEALMIWSPVRHASLFSTEFDKRVHVFLIARSHFNRVNLLPYLPLEIIFYIIGFFPRRQVVRQPVAAAPPAPAIALPAPAFDNDTYFI